MLFILGIIALGLTGFMFRNRERLLGFPSGIFWALFGGYCFTLSVATWDMYYLMGFASLLGMVTFCIYSAFALREKRDTIADEQMEKGEGAYIDEGKEETGLTDEGEGDNPKLSKRTRAVRARAKARRERPGRSSGY